MSGRNGFERSLEIGERLDGVDLLFPTVHHVPIPWVMGYDMRPTVTLTEKAKLCAESVQHEWIWFMEHDAHHVFMTIQQDDRGRYKGVPLGASELPF